jgi:hypothetical protein
MNRNIYTCIDYLFGKDLIKFHNDSLNCDYYFKDDFEPILEVNHNTNTVSYRYSVISKLSDSFFNQKDIDETIIIYLSDNYNINVSEVRTFLSHSIRKIKQEFFKSLNLQ